MQPLPSRSQAWWDRYFLRGAEWVSSASRDPSTKVGAVIVRPNRTPASVGYNGFPRKIRDTAERLKDRDMKLKLTVHGEINALNWATEPVTGYTLYTWPFLTCSKCAIQVIQAGITRVVAPFVDNPRWNDSFREAQALYEEAEVYCDLINMENDVAA
ncbi:dCMP deaminase [Bradyrhizobium sp. AZCC 1610]|uniref:deaminase n=1 Tax=Bradyrhizobium sp. AZCC 1610 TaxID=3117020 RepID=UPI002FEF8E9C